MRCFYISSSVEQIKRSKISVTLLFFLSPLLTVVSAEACRSNNRIFNSSACFCFDRFRNFPRCFCNHMQSCVKNLFYATFYALKLVFVLNTPIPQKITNFIFRLLISFMKFWFVFVITEATMVV